MVLQRDKAVPVWGKADAGEEVVVEFAGQKKSAKAGADGKWMVKLDAMPPNAVPQVLKAGNVSVQDVVVGEVWLASGQSNMELEMQSKPDSQADLPKATHDNIRLAETAYVAALAPKDDVATHWNRCTPQSAASFSAVGYYFALRLQEELKVPVGIILSSWGGTRIEPWTSLEGFDAVPETRDFGADVRAKLPGGDDYRKAQEAHLEAVTKWQQTVRDALAKKEAVPAMPPQPMTAPADQNTPTALYNAMIHPLVPFAIRGALWYQGEANHNEAFAYTDKTKALLASWRGAFQQPDLPFYFVQIAPWPYGAEDPEMLAQFWQAQKKCLEIPHTGMASIADIGEIADIHPANKKEVARRLSLWALSKTYGRSEIDPSGPMYASHSVEGAAMRVKFDHAAGGLVTRDGKPPAYFEIAGTDGVFQPAEAHIDGESVVLTSAQVTKPVRVRFAWSKLALPNLANKAGLPAFAFHSHWPIDPDLGENFARGCTWQCSDPNLWGWDTGLTDGSWASLPPNCFATAATDVYPKHVTINLKQARTLNLVVVGTPEFGSTKTIAISLSTDGQTFREVGRHEFPFGKAERATISFPDAEAKFIRLSYIDHHNQQSRDFATTFGFTSELEAYRVK